MATSSTITEFLASVGFKADQKSLKASLATVAAFGVAVQAVAVGIYAGITRVASGEAAMARQAERLGTTSDKLQELGYIAEQSGSSLDAVTKSMEALVSKNPRIKDAARALEVVGERMKAMNEAQRKAYAARMGIDPSLIPALISDASALKDEFRAMYAVAGIDAKEAAKASKEFMGEIGKLTTMVGLLAKSVTLAFIGKIRHDVERLRRVIMENFDTIKQVLEILINVVLRVASVISAFVYRVIKLVSSLVQWFGKLDDGQKKLAVGASLLLAAWKLLNAGFLTTPLGMIIMGLLGIIALVDDYLEGGENYFDWGPWAGTIETARAAISKVVSAVVSFVSEHQGLVKSLAKGVALFMGLKKAAGVVGLVSGAFKALNMVIRANPIGLILGLFCMGAMWVIDNWEMVKNFFVETWRKIEDAFPNFAAWIQAGIAAITAFGAWLLSFFTGNFDQAGQQALQLFASLGDMAIAVLSMLGNAIAGIFSAAWEAVEQAFPDFGAWAAGAVQSMKGLFGNGIQWIKEKIASLIDFLPDWLKEKMGLKVGGDFDTTVNNALAASQAAVNPAPLAPSPAQAASMDNSVKQDVTLDAKTEINVYTSDPVAAGNQAAARQSQVNADLVRHTKGGAR